MGGASFGIAPPNFFCFTPLTSGDDSDILPLPDALGQGKEKHMATANKGKSNDQPETTTLDIQGVTLVFGETMPEARAGQKGTSKYDEVIEAIRTQSHGQPVLLQGMKPSSAAQLKKRYPDIQFVTRGVKSGDATVWAFPREDEEETVSA